MLRFVCGTAFAAPAVARGIQRRTG
jgi:hypothetical protein